MKNLVLVLSIFFSHSTFAQTSLGGKVTDEETGEALLFANVAVYKKGNLVTGTQTDFDGFYNIANIDPGTYDVEVSYSGYQSIRIIKVIVYGGQANNVDFTLPNSVGNDKPKIIEFVPLVLYTAPSSDCLTFEQINELWSQSRRRKAYFRTPHLLERLPRRTISSIAQDLVDFRVSGVTYGSYY